MENKSLAGRGPSTPEFNVEEINTLLVGREANAHWLTGQLNKLMSVKAAALATPSPQAPPEQSNTLSTTSAREQSAATASSSPSAAETVTWPPIPEYMLEPIVFRDANLGIAMVAFYRGEQWVLKVNKETWLTIRKVTAEDPLFIMETLNEPTAATQEQPAGSGASELFAYVCPANCGCMWRDNQDGTMSLFGPRSQSCEVCETLPLEKLIPVHVHRWTAEQIEEGRRRGKETYAAIAGSPRKVGEDAQPAIEKEIATHNDELMACKKDCYEEMPYTTGKRDGLLRALILLRPTLGVPVGEEKQEEGV